MDARAIISARRSANPKGGEQVPTTSVIEADVQAGDAPPARSRKRLILVAAGVVALLGAAGGGYAWWSREPAPAAMLRMSGWPSR